MVPEAVIFDYDGVLVEMDRERAVSFFRGRAPLPVKGLHRRWEIWCAQHLGEHLPAQEMWSVFWRTLGAELGIEEQPLEEICAFDYLGLFRACDDTPGALREAKRLGLRIGVLSNSALPKLEAPSAPIALSQWADVIRVPGDGAAVKPDRQAYLDMARLLGTTPDRCLFFDNDPGFVEAARDVGMRAFLVSRGPGAPAGDPSVLKDLSELSRLAAGGASPASGA